MATQTNETTCRLRVEIADDRMQAWIRPVNPGDLHSLTFAEIVPALEEAKIIIDDSVGNRIEAYVTLVAGERDRPKRLLVAEGRHA